MLTVWRRETKTDGGYTHTTRVEITGDGRVNVSAFSIGPRGGSMTYGITGFSKLEWEAINAAVELRYCAMHNAPGERLYAGGDDVTGWGCRLCFFNVLPSAEVRDTVRCM